MKYFVSYTTKENEVTKELLESIAKVLKQKGEVYIDLIDNDSINKQERVINELDNSDVFLLIETKSVYDSAWVQIELEKAKSRQIDIQILSITDINAIISEK